MTVQGNPVLDEIELRITALKFAHDTANCQYIDLEGVSVLKVAQEYYNYLATGTVPEIQKGFPNFRRQND